MLSQSGIRELARRPSAHFAAAPLQPAQGNKRGIFILVEPQSMGPKEFLLSICCCECLGVMRAPSKQPLLSKTFMAYRALESPRDFERNLWSSPCDSSHTQADDDRELLNLLHKREEADQGSEEWQKLNYDIHTLRQTRRRQENRWKRILEELGFQNEASTLLAVTKSSIIHSQNPNPAQQMLQRLTKETSIFLNECQVPERYLFVLDRLLVLDAAEDFLWKASQRYPRNDE